MLKQDEKLKRKAGVEKEAGGCEGANPGRIVMKTACLLKELIHWVFQLPCESSFYSVYHWFILLCKLMCSDLLPPPQKSLFQHFEIVCDYLPFVPCLGFILCFFQYYWFQLPRLIFCDAYGDSNTLLLTTCRCI